MREHKINCLRSYLFSSNGNVPLVFTVRIIYQNDHLALFQVFYNFLYRVKSHQKHLSLNTEISKVLFVIPMKMGIQKYRGLSKRSLHIEYVRAIHELPLQVVCRN